MSPVIKATVVTSCSSSRRLEYAGSWLAQRSPGEEVLILAANRHAADDLVRRIALKSGAVFGWHRMTLPQLAVSIATPILASLGLATLSPLGGVAMAARAVDRCDKDGRLGIYKEIGRTPGFSRAVASTLSELRLAGVQASALQSVSSDIATILRIFENELDEARLIDWAGLLSCATEAVEADKFGSRRLAKLPMLFVDVPIENEAVARFIRALVASAPELVATVPAGDAVTVERLQESSDVVLKLLDTDLGKDSVYQGTIALRRLQSNLFGRVDTPIETLGDASVDVFSAPSEGRECVEIARRVLHMASEGTPFDRIAVLLRSPEQYRTHLEEAFGRAGIPFHLARGAVRPEPGGRAFCALLRCAIDGLSARRFAEYLSLGQVPDASADGRPPAPSAAEDRWAPADHDLMPLSVTTATEAQAAAVSPVAEDDDHDQPVKQGQLRAPRRWEQLLVEAAVIGGRDRWRRRLGGLEHGLRIQLAALESDDDARFAAAQKTLDDLLAFTRFVLPLIDDLDDLPQDATWEFWLQRLGDLATRAIRHPDRVLSVLTELAPMGPVGPVSIEEVTAVLEGLLLEVAAPSPSPVYGRVFVASVEAARGLRFDAVFVPGLAEKLFPRRIVEEPLLLDGARARLPGRLPTNQTRVDRERLALTIATGAADKQISFSYPRLDLEQGRPRVPSFYALETVRAAEGRLLDFAELARRTATGTTARLGWPAPLQPADAIDASEFDLAVLASITDDGSAGAARYLLDANPHLARALRSRYQRWGQRWTTADGLVKQSPVTDGIMALHKLGARSYSPTALQNFAACPYKFFLQAIHRLAPRDEPAEIEHLDPLQRGSFIHDCQFQLLALLRERKLLPVRAKGLPAVLGILEEIVTANAAQYRDDLAPAIERVWEDEIASIHADLREWLRLASEDESGYVPWQFELAFGLAHRRGSAHVDPASVSASADLDCGIQLRGSIDLVERHPSGGLRVTDHKTGKAGARRGQTIAGGSSLQPLLYALAAEKISAGKAEVAEGRLYFCTSRGGFADHVVALNDESREIAREVAKTIGDALDRSFLPAAPDSGQCDWCDYRCVCGPYEELRVSRKSVDALEDLFALRALP